MELNDFITQLGTAAQEMGADALRVFVRLLALGVQQNTSLLQISDRWLMRDLGMSQQAVTEAKKRIRAYVQLTCTAGRPSVFALPLPWLPAQICLFPTPHGVFHISTGALPGSAECTGKRAPLHGGAVQSAPGDGATAPVDGAECTDYPCRVHGGAVQSAPVSSAAAPVDEDARARAESTRSIEGLSVIEGVNRLIYKIARLRSIPPAYKAEGEKLRDRLTTFMRKNSAHPNSLMPADDRITAQIQAVAPIGRVLKELDKLDSEGRNVRDSYGYVLFTLINRVHGAKSETIREIFELVKEERENERGAQMKLGDYGLNVDTLARKLA